MMHPRHLFRALYIHGTFVRFGVVHWTLPRHLTWMSMLNPIAWFSQQRDVGRGEGLRLALESLGPIFVKFGQILSTRPDLLPIDIALELTKLQDHVMPFPGKQAQEVVEQALGKSISDAFAEFEIIPIASASIAQVHKARLPTGQEVAVKVLRPKIHEHIQKDVALMYALAKVVARLMPKRSERLRLKEVVAEFERHLTAEVDLEQEGANAASLRHNLRRSDQMYVPDVFWEYTRKSVLVTEFIHGVRIDDIEKLHAAGVNCRCLAENGVEIFFTQVLRDSFFHADMHPGNIFVIWDNPNQPKYAAVDFGIMGVLRPEDQFYLAENLLAFFERDYCRVAQLHVQCGWVPKDTSVEAFTAAMRAVSEPVFAKPLKEVSFGELILRLLQTAQQFEMQVQPQLLMLQKTLLNIEGLGRQLYPDLNLWDTAYPFLKKWLKERRSPKRVFKQIARDGPIWLEHVAQLPQQLNEYLQRPTMIQVVKPRRWLSFLWGMAVMSGILALCFVMLIVR